MPRSPKLFVTGASGQLGGLVIDRLLARTSPSEIIAGMRDVTSPTAVALRNKDVEVRETDYARPETLVSAFAGVDRLLLISSSENGQRREQHRNVVAAAKDAGIGLIAYTSILHADRSPLFLAEEHRDTEAALAESGVPFVLLRNSWYTEVYTWRLPAALQQGVLTGAAGEGRISSAARADYADAAAAVLRHGDHAGRVYELAGDTSFTLAELATVVAQATGKSFVYQDMRPQDFAAASTRAGMPEPVVKIVADTDAGVSKGALFDTSHQLSALIGRPTTPVNETIRAYLQSLRG